MDPIICNHIKCENAVLETRKVLNYCSDKCRKAHERALLSSDDAKFFDNYINFHRLAQKLEATKANANYLFLYGLQKQSIHTADKSEAAKIVVRKLCFDKTYYTTFLDPKITRTPSNGISVNDILEGGLADLKTVEDIAAKHGVTVDYINQQLASGIEVEKEHTTNLETATEIAKDHLWERADYYVILTTAEKAPSVIPASAKVTAVEQLAKGGPVESAMIFTDEQLITDYPKLTKGQAKKVYEQVKFILDSNTELTPEVRKTLEQYEGLGGTTDTGIISEAVKHQYYTPYVICKKMFELAAFYGFKGGTILEPACGTGRFFKFAPKGSKIIGFDLEKTNIDIATKLYPNVTLYQQSFETAFLQEPNFNKKAKQTWLPPVDLVIGNPPYGDYEGYYKTYMPKLYNRFEFLFIRLGLETLKPGGLLLYVVSQNIMNNGMTYNKMKQDMLDIGEFVDAYRLPVGIFSSTDVGTDILIFRRK